MEFMAKELADATRNYSRTSIVGKGGYGIVYRGTLRYSTVAIKILSQVHVRGIYLRCSHYEHVFCVPIRKADKHF